MSSLFSDPSWRRGGTLLAGEAIEVDANSTPIAGRDIVGQVKIFQDVNPSTGAVNSNRLVYCVAARYTGSAGLTSADAGKVVVFDAANPLTAFDDTSLALADSTGLVAGKAYGVLDEYIPEGVSIRQNDIVWVVAKGPCTVQKLTGAGNDIPSGAVVEISATDGKVQDAADGTGLAIGQCLATAATTATTARINLNNPMI
jgi:predicted RecA/RadA family phage recombinase